MLEKDEDFYRKVLGCMQKASPTVLKITVVGGKLRLRASNGVTHEIPPVMFYCMSTAEILNMMEIKNDRNRNP